jgi:hypothetical protein
MLLMREEIIESLWHAIYCIEAQIFTTRKPLLRCNKSELKAQ